MRRSDHWLQSVRRHWDKSIGYLLVTGGGMCPDFALKEVQRINRRFEQTTLGWIGNGVLPGSWILGVLVCEGGNVDGLIPWADALEEDDLRRICFYIFPDAPSKVLNSWESRGFYGHSQREPESWNDFHVMFANQLGDQILEDVAKNRFT